MYNQVVILDNCNNPAVILDNCKKLEANLTSFKLQKQTIIDWVINLFKTPLTPAQQSLLAKGPNFVVTPQAPLI